jgi:aminopeptidase N
MEVYSRFSFDYPYPTAQSVNTWLGGGMEYPMITFNGRRPKPFEPDEDTVSGDFPDSTYSRQVKYGLINVIIHEIGHIYFPMTVNSDERQWTWMDEGLNSFLEYLAELEWEEEHPAYKDDNNVLEHITEYMQSEYQVPIMTQSDAIWQFGPNAYTKPTAALVVLRETVMGRELFDFAFKEYSRRWMFKRPTPADFFRTMEDASGIDLDWFWRGWFYSTDHVDVAITSLREYKISSLDPDVEFDRRREQYRQDVPENVSQIRNREEGRQTRLQRKPQLGDFYNENDRFTVTNKDRNKYLQQLEELEDWERAALERAIEENRYVYFIDFSNIGGLPSPLPLLITNADGSEESVMLPAEIWRRNHREVTKLMIRDQAITSVDLDPLHQTADVDYSNNQFPSRVQRSRIELYKYEDTSRDLMADMLQRLRQSKGNVDESGREVQLQPAGN